MKIVAYTPLHYGKAYLRWAVAAVAPIVDRHIILYTPRPSFGYSLPDQVCPDTEEELRACVDGFNHVEWHTGTWEHEGKHRDEVLMLLRSEQILLPVDADEVWDTKSLEHVIRTVVNSSIRARNWRLHGMHHLFRSFAWECQDAMAPVRVVDLRADGDAAYVPGQCWHFGYAQDFRTMAYKWSCHGHRPELRRDWWPRFLEWKPGDGDMHPTCENTWYPVPVTGTIPEVLDDHPWRHKEIIT